MSRATPQFARDAATRAWAASDGARPPAARWHDERTRGHDGRVPAPSDPDRDPGPAAPDATHRSGPDRNPEAVAGGRPVLRAGDADRERVAQRLRRAHDEGRLDLDEFDERITSAYAARTFADLDELTADLPPDTTPARTPVRRDRVDRPVQRRPDKAAVQMWATASVVNIAIWGILAVSVGVWVYPWWIWVAAPWGVVLLMQWITSRGERPPE
jgi:hypothetical protein